MVNSKHLVLFPSGQPETSENRDRCAALLISCGADVIRFLDSPWTSLDQMVRYIARLDEIVSGSAPPIVVLTQTNPLKLVTLQVRERLTKTVVNLKLALWVIYVDPEEDPFFFANAAASGSFDLLDEVSNRADPARVWTPRQQLSDLPPERYLVLTPATARDEYLRARAQSLWEEAQERPPESITATKLRAMLLAQEDSPTSRRRTR